MHRPRLAPVILLTLTLLLAACQQAASQPPAGTDGGQPSAAGAEPGASQPAGNGGGGGGDNGSAQYEITGDYAASGELRFVPEASYFEQGGSTYLSFTNEGESTVLFISFSDSGNFVQFGDENASVVQAGEACTMNLTRDDATGAAGTFDCPNSSVVLTGSEQLGTGTIRGSFEAHL
jgi:hypothetical protein